MGEMIHVYDWALKTMKEEKQPMVFYLGEERLGPGTIVDLEIKYHDEIKLYKFTFTADIEPANEGTLTRRVIFTAANVQKVELQTRYKSVVTLKKPEGLSGIDYDLAHGYVVYNYLEPDQGEVSTNSGPKP